MTKNNYAVHGDFGSCTYETYKQALKYARLGAEENPGKEFTIFRAISRHTLKITQSKLHEHSIKVKLNVDD